MIIRIISVAILLFVGAFLFFNSGGFSLPAIFDTDGEAPAGEDTDIDIEDEVSVDVEEDVSVGIEGIGESILPGENVVEPESLPSAVLTELGVLVWTNFQRISIGVKPLAKSPLLDEVANAKLNDMFENQYFAHEAPNGDYVGDLAKDFGYRYLLIGENLAYGDFANDRTLVDAWMGSPGHKENILKEGYTEIGIAVGKGMFEGRETWLAVQSFGTPYSICDVVDASLLDDINDGKEELDDLENVIDETREDLEATYPKSGSEYNEKVDAYNELVNEFNNLLKTVNSWVKIYNAQVEEFKNCIDSVI